MIQWYLEISFMPVGTVDWKDQKWKQEGQVGNCHPVDK